MGVECVLSPWPVNTHERMMQIRLDACTLSLRVEAQVVSQQGFIFDAARLHLGVSGVFSHVELAFRHHFTSYLADDASGLFVDVFQKGALQQFHVM